MAAVAAEIGEELLTHRDVLRILEVHLSAVTVLAGRLDVVSGEQRLGPMVFEAMCELRRDKRSALPRMTRCTAKHAGTRGLAHLVLLEYIEVRVHAEDRRDDRDVSILLRSLLDDLEMLLV